MLYQRIETALEYYWPQDNDFNKVFIPKLHPDESKLLTDEILDTLLMEQICVIIGAEGRGKTTLVKFLGHKYQNEYKSPAWCVNLAEEGDKGDEDSLLEDVIIRDSNKEILQIIENAHARPELWDRIEKLARKPKSRILITSRVTKKALGYEESANPIIL